MENYIDKLNYALDFEGDFLKKIRKAAEEEGVPVMKTDTAKFLTTISKLKNPKNILEIGTAVGYSGSLLLKYSDKESKLTTIEIDPKSAEIAKQNFKAQNFASRSMIFIGNAEEIIPLTSGKFDLIFLDGPKSHYGEFMPYLKKMLALNGSLICDNVLFRNYVSGEKKNPHRMQTIVNNMREFLNNLTNDADFLTQVFEIGDGVSVSVKIKG